MHEWSLANSIISKVVELSEGRRPVKVEIGIGELMEIENDILLQALDVISRETGLNDVRFVVKTETTRFRCNSCNAEWGWKEMAEMEELKPYFIIDEGEPTTPFHFLPYLVHAIVKCPRCGSRDFETVSGDSVRLLSLEVEE